MSSDAWLAGGNLATARWLATATLLANGKVLVAGGSDSFFVPFASAEIYDPAKNGWSSAGTLLTARRSHTATLLTNGKILVVGGTAGDSSSMATAELYDPASNTWSCTGSLTTGRTRHTATLLGNGKVLVAGGDGAGGSLASAELFDPITGTWSNAGNMATARSLHTATLISNGKILVAAGRNLTSGGAKLKSAELYDSTTNTWASAGSMSTARDLHTATLLPNGKLLVAGGTDGSISLGSAELYDSVTNTWTSGGALSVPRSSHTATLLPNGKLFLVGGSNVGISTDVYDPTSNVWSPGSSLGSARDGGHTATLLPNGRVLVAAGLGALVGPLSSSELFDSTSGAWSAAGSLTTAREDHKAVLLPNGKVLVVAGAINFSTRTNTAELYDPVSNTWSSAGTLTTGRIGFTITLLSSGRVLIAGGWNATNLASAELYDPATNQWSNASNLGTARSGHSATLLSNGKVLVAGGLSNGGIVASAELYDPSTNTWGSAASLATARSLHSSTLLPNGRVLVGSGLGLNGVNAVASAELYDSTSNSWSSANNLTTGRWGPTATLLANGKVLVAGGYNDITQEVASAELYDSTTNSWSSAGSLTTARDAHTATLLPNNKVLVAGGTTSGRDDWLPSVELYDPSSNTWSDIASLATARAGHTATLLSNGKVVVAGGGNVGTFLASAELFDIGLGFNSSWQPQLTSATSPLNLSSSLVLSGSRFKGVSGASGGNNQDSSTNYPLVQLRSLVNEQTTFLLSDRVANWTDTSFTSRAITGFPVGHAMVTVFTNGIPSASRIINITNTLSLTVTNTNDSGPGSLRQAILNANANPGPDTITFGLPPGPFPPKISPVTVLPTITDPVIIDGTTQQGGAVPGAIHLDGSGALPYGLRITAGNSTVRGFSFTNFNGPGISLETGGGNLIELNELGIVSLQIGYLLIPNTVGIRITSANNRILSNTISGNLTNGIEISGPSATGNVVQGNRIGGTAPFSGEPIPNGGAGIYVCCGASNNLIGGDNCDINIIAFNSGGGILLNSGTGNRIHTNAIFSNVGFGIKLENGANGNQAAPVLTSSAVSAGIASVFGTLNSTANANFTIHWAFGSDPQCVDNQFASQPLRFSKLPVITDAAGKGSFSFDFALPPGITTGVVNSTAQGLNGTSAFSPCLPVNSTQATQTLTVASSNPGSGVNITVSPNDNNNAGNGFSEFTRTYNHNLVVNLTAPATAGSNGFLKWQKDGTDFANNTQTNVSVIMDANHTLTAVYVTPTRTLTVASSNPVSGVGITVSPNDNNAAGNGTTQFTRTYNNNQVVSLTAPATASGNTFQKWLKDGANFANNTLANVSVTMDANHTMTAVYLTPTRTLTVASSNPVSGVGITVSPNDNNAAGNGTTQFTRTYNNNQVVSLTAPATASGNTFQKWLKDGANFANNTLANVSVTMDANHTMTAVYLTPTRTLTVASSNPVSGVSITVSPNDNNSAGNGTTQFTRTYNNNQVVSLTAPATASGNTFQKWLKDGIDFANNTLANVSVTMDANHTMTAVYLTPTRTLTVASSNPASGVSITVSPNDNNAAGNGTTQFTRTYNKNQLVSLTAPATVAGNNFQKWLKDGADFANNTQANVSVTMDANHTMTAVYLTPTSTKTLTIASLNPGSGVNITVTPNDNGSQGNGTTQFTRTYNVNTAVNLTAPTTAGGNNFQKWLKDGADFANNTNANVSVTMDLDHSMTAVYVIPNAIKLDSSSYTAAENVGSKLVTIMRTGDTSGPATVNYATSDAAGANGCNLVNGNASSRCDYTPTLGTLNFAAGEPSKTISLPITDDAYDEGNETLTVTLSNAIGVTLGSPSSAAVSITDNETTNGANPLSSDRYFVRMHYLDFLNREPDVSGWDFWTNQATTCGAADVLVCRVNVSASFFTSIEFQETGYLVERTYKSAYGDATGASTFGGAHQLQVPVVRLNEFLADTQQITRGVVVLQPGWEQLLESNNVAFFAGFVQRSRFTTAFPTSMTPAAFVDLLNTRAGNVLLASERTSAINLFGGAGNTMNLTARARALRQVAEDQDLQNAEFNRAFVLMQYFGYLRRNPNDPQDTDYTGYDFWLTKLNQFNGDYINAEMVKAFITSIEYRGRFGP